ncbi:MAG: lactonase family protein, partial [Pirellulaceae bacterium]
MPNPLSWQPRAILIGVSLAAFLPAPHAAPADDVTSRSPSLVYFGTYTRGTPSQGIYVAEFDPTRGTLQAERLAAQADNPSFLAIHPNGKWLYCVNEVADFGGAASKSGAVTAFAMDPVGQLTQLNQQSTRGTGPCHVTVDATGKWLLTANYGGGSVCVHPIGPDGQLGPPTSFVQHQGKSVNPRRQDAPHAHSIHLDPANRFAFVADLGLDRVLSYHFDADQGKLAANPSGQGAVAPGSGPRHFAFHPNGQLAFTNNEITCGVTAFRYDAARGALSVVDVASSLPAGTELNGNSTAECLVHPTG